jgi:beta-lactamase regulating signal transducer with metallopeptidase domain
MNASDFCQALDAIKARYPLQLTLALVHFLWQGCAIAIVYAGVAGLLRQAPAKTRYVAGVMALLLMAACLPVTLLILPAPPMEAVGAATHLSAISTPETISPTAGETAVNLAAPDAAPAAMPASPGILSESPPSPGDVPAGAPIRQPAANRVTSVLTWASPYTSGLYLCGVALMLLHVALGLWGGRRLRRACTPVTDGAILTRVRDHARRLRMRVIPVVAYCRRISVPVVVGVLRPMILMPASLASGLTMRQIEAVLLHELAHIRRFDPVVNVLQRLVEAMLFFHPAVWWVSRRISAERESACDDLVLRSNYGRTEYADALVHVGELCTARSDRDAFDRAALAATGEKASQFKRRVLRLLDNNNKPAIRLTSTGIVMSILLILSLLLAPVAWRSAARAEDERKAEEAKAESASEPENSSKEATSNEAGQPAKPENLQPVSMSAEEFGRLSAAEQRALLVRVFQRRLEHSKNLYYETDQTLRILENRAEEPGTVRSFRSRYRHWRLGGSFRMDAYGYKNPGDVDWSSHSSYGVNAEEGVGRNTQVSKDPKRPPTGQVQYPFDPSSSMYVHWLDGKYRLDLLIGMPRREDYVFRYLLEHQAEFEITAPAAGDKVQLSFPWKPEWAETAGGKRVYLLDPRKGFLPVSCDSRYDDPPTKMQPSWREEKFMVEESRLVGDVWMPIKLTEMVATSSAPGSVSMVEIKVLRIEGGTVRPADIVVQFTEGMEVIDTIVAVRYVADARGKPAGPVKPAPGWKSQPPETWPRRPPAVAVRPERASAPPRPSTAAKGATASSMASRLSAADVAMLAKEEQQKQERRLSIEAPLKVLQSRPPAAQDQRIEAALQILRIYQIGANEAAWASAIRELILIDKPAVPKLIQELDRTEREETLRALGFVLRGIGDPRAVPALVRAIPRTLQPPRSDYGLVIEGDPVLQTFMQQHDTEGRAGSRWFNYGRPINEIMSALRETTGETHGWMELRFTHLEGGVEQQRIKRQLFLKLAERWADWWSKNWQKYVRDEADAQLDLTRRALDQYSKSFAAAPSRPPRSEFPRGPNVTVGDSTRNQLIRSFDESPSDGFLDLDSGRHPCPPKGLLTATARHEPSKELLAWAEQEGVDLVNVKITPPGSDKTFYAFKPLGMKVWRIENSRFANIQKELRESKRLDLPAPWQGPLALIDQKSGKHDDKLTVSFLFITREGTCGAIQLQAPLSRELVPGTPTRSVPGGLRYKLIYEPGPKSP